MEAMVKEWTDGRLDDLSGRVDHGFAQVDQRFDRVEGEIRGLRMEMRTELKALRAEMHDEFKAVRSEMTAEFGRVHAEIGKVHAEIRGLRNDLGDRAFALQRTMVQIVIGLAASMVVGFVGIFTLLLAAH